MNDVRQVAVPHEVEEAVLQHDTEALIDQVCQDMSGTVPRPVVAQTVTKLFAKHDDAAIRHFVPMLVRREARELLRMTDLTEIEAKSRKSIISRSLQD